MGIVDLPEAMSLAHQGLTGAAWRTLDADRRKHLLSCAVAATEALHWICALDEQLEKGSPGYKSRRNQDTDGSVLPGLRHVRDRAMHQVVICTAQDRSLGRTLSCPAALPASAGLMVWISSDGSAFSSSSRQPPY